MPRLPSHAWPVPVLQVRSRSSRCSDMLFPKIPARRAMVRLLPAVAAAQLPLAAHSSDPSQQRLLVLGSVQLQVAVSLAEQLCRLCGGFSAPLASCDHVLLPRHSKSPWKNRAAVPAGSCSVFWSTVSITAPHSALVQSANWTPTIAPPVMVTPHGSWRAEGKSTDLAQ